MSPEPRQKVPGSGRRAKAGSPYVQIRDAELKRRLVEDVLDQADDLTLGETLRVIAWYVVTRQAPAHVIVGEMRRSLEREGLWPAPKTGREELPE